MYDPVRRTYNGIPEENIMLGTNAGAIAREQLRQRLEQLAMDRRLDQVLGTCDNCDEPMPLQDHVCRERYYDPMSKMPGWEMLGMYPKPGIGYWSSQQMGGLQ